jgi:hypothetical protein
MYVPYFCTVLADVSAHLGHTDDGLQPLAEAYTLIEQQEERYWEAEVSRLRGVLLLRQLETPQDEAETYFQQALAIARRHEPGAPVAAAGQACGSLRATGADLRLVHRGL